MLVALCELLCIAELMAVLSTSILPVLMCAVFKFS